VRIGPRLLLAVVPAVLGVVVVVALAYFGEYGRQAPAALVAIAAAATVISLIVSWRNSRWLARRIERLVEAARRAPLDTSGRSSGQHGASALHGLQALGIGVHTGDLDTVQRRVEALVDAVVNAEADTKRHADEAARQVRDFARQLGALADRGAVELAEVQLPLHILLENRFGELNENQEEMLGAARDAAERLERELGALRELAALEAGAVALRRDRVRLDDVITPLVPGLQAVAELAGVRFAVELAPALPAIVGDRERLRAAFVALLEARVRAAGSSHGDVALSGERDGQNIHVRITPGATATPTLAEQIGRRVLALHGGTITDDAGATDVRLPVA
jgi:signal transduction histidine kinase